MKNVVRTLLICCSIFSATVDADTRYDYSGYPEHPTFLKYETTEKKSDYHSILLNYLAEYATAMANEAPTCYGFDAPEMGGISLPEAKQMILERIADHPEEVNDISIGCGENGTPLSMATRICDYDIVRALLANGAIPYSANGVEYYDGYFDYGCASRTTQEDKMRVEALIQEAQRKWPQVKAPRFNNILKSDFYRLRCKKREFTMSL